MNYALHYERLMDRARNRILEGYRERHHVLPRCMGGRDESKNLVNLTPEEHYVAHQLLVKMYPEVRGLATAAVRMAKQCTGNKAYGWLRRRHARAISILFRGRPGHSPSEETRAKIAAGMRGKKHSPETLAKMSAVHRGRTFSNEHRAKLSAASRGKPKSAEHVAHLIAAKKANPLSASTRERMGSSMRGKHHSEEGKKKISQAIVGITRSPETRRKMAESKCGNRYAAGRKLSPEHIAKMTAARLASYAAKKQEARQRADVDG